MSAPAALLVIDVQQGFLDPSWGRTNNPTAENHIRALLMHWRERRWPIVLVRHDSLDHNSPLRPGQSGNNFQDGIDGAHDLLLSKNVNSAFFGSPNLDEWLTSRSITGLVICGITTNHCCETTARMAGNLGYRVEFVLDATRAFDTEDIHGVIIPAEDIARTTAANLNGEFATVTTTASVIEGTLKIT